MTKIILPSGHVVYDPRGQITVDPVTPTRRPASLEATSPADGALFDQIAKEVDVVITAIGD